ncbi:MAG: TetR/AcrR family transcriptional regulator [Planctomycetota bacterium]|nr:TetR/AcrR family transcriptional regulator [Planctomycetota bacterium]
MSTDTQAPGRKDPSTRERLLQSAIALFAEKGFSAASVREICAGADANIAAINYYFGSKDRLYADAVKEVYHRCEGISSMPRLADAPDAPDVQLAAWIDWFVTAHFDPGMSQMTLFLRRELAHPTPVLHEIIDELLQPPIAVLSELVRALLGSSPTDAEVLRMCTSITAPILMGTVCAPLTQCLGLPEAEDQAAFSQHCVRWAMAGLASSGASVGAQWAVPG